MNRLSRPVKAFLGFLSFLPVVYSICLAIIFIAYLFRTPNIPVLLTRGLLFSHIAVILLIISLSLYYAQFIFKSGKIPKPMRANWTAFLFVGNVLALPLFWYIHFWNDQTLGKSMVKPD